AVKKGDVLKVGQVNEGARGYLLFGKPLDISKVADSFSTHTRSQIGGFKGRALKSGDLIGCLYNTSYKERLGISLPFNLEINNNSHNVVFKVRDLKSGYLIGCLYNTTYKERLGISLPFNLAKNNNKPIQIIEGPQIDHFSKEAQQKLVSKNFEISEKSDRMG